MQDFVTRYDFPFQLLQATVSSKMLLNPKVLLCICLTFIPFNNGQIRTLQLPRPSNRFGDGTFNNGQIRTLQFPRPSNRSGDGMNIEYEPQLQLRPESAPRYLHLESNDPATIFLKTRNIMAKVKDDPGTYRGGTYYPRDGSRPIHIYPSEREDLGHIERGPRRQLTESDKKMNAWIESRISTPTNEEEIEYFKQLGSFPGTHYLLPKHCMVNATCSKKGFAPVGFIMDRDVVHSCPLGNLIL